MPQPNYEDDLVFDHDANTMPRCDIEDLKKQLETANFYRNQNAEYIQRLEEENKQLRELLRVCLHFLGYASAVSSDERNINAIEAMTDKIKDAIGESEEWTERQLECDKLIAEYPTWQEAVNSPEFKGEK